MQAGLAVVVGAVLTLIGLALVGLYRAVGLEGFAIFCFAGGASSWLLLAMFIHGVGEA